MPKHIARLILVILVFGVAAGMAKVFFTADSFYRYGHYRGDSVAEIAADKPKFKGSAYCQGCHAPVFADWSKGAHHSPDRGKAVQCEVCHGAAGGRDAGGMFEHVATGVDHPASGKLPVPADSVRLCTLCHEKTAGRPAQQPQIEVATHAGTQQCTSCHNPHSPRPARIGGATLASATAAPGKAAACAGCHGADGVSSNPSWPNLARQRSAYLVEALKAYKAGTRGNAMMAAAAKALSERDMREVAGFYSRLKTKDPRGAGAPPAARPDVSACAACHGADGVSANPAWPNLAGQRKDYLLTALKSYKDGARKSDMMTGIAAGLSDAQMEALATYYGSLP